MSKEIGSDSAADLDTFNSAIGGTSLLVITVGSTTEAGNALFTANAEATTITAFGGDNAAETGLIEFQTTAGASNLVLDDATGVTVVTVNATNGVQTFSGTVVGGDAGDGTLSVIDDDPNAAPDAITFSGQFGATQLGALTVGSTTQGGSAIFTSATTAVIGAITVTGGDNAAEDSVAEFEDDVTATSFVLNDGTGTATLKIGIS